MSDHGTGEWPPAGGPPADPGSPELPPAWLAAGGWAPPDRPYGAHGPGLPQTEPLTTWSLVLGILSLFLCGPIFGLAAIITGARAKQAIDSSGGARGGRGNAVAGQVLGAAGMVVSVIGGGLVLAFIFLLPHPTSYTRLSTSDCFNRSTGTVSAHLVTKVSCDEAHLGEVVGSFDAGDGPWPGPAGLQAIVGRRCDDAARRYTASRPPGVGVYFLYPRQSSWGNGTRRIVCELHNRDGSQRTGSVAAA